MTPAAARVPVEARIKAQWTATTIAWPNVLFTPPASGSWLRVDWVWGIGSTVAKGGRQLTTGLVQLAIFGPQDQGDGALDTLAQTARAILNGLRMASPNQDIVFGPASGPVRRVEESWRSLVVSCPIQVYESV